MIRFLFGASGHGKTAAVAEMLRRDAEAGKPCLLIVPEQEAVSAERMTLEALPPHAQLTMEILNFSRLFNRVCREYGGLSYSYITKPMKHVLMWRALRETAPILGKYSQNAVSDPAFASTVLSTASELKHAGITVGELEEAAHECGERSETLGARLRDIALILGTYETFVSQKYSDSSDDLSRLCGILDEHDFFEGKNVYIDSFSSFTAAEHRVIERIFRGADNVAVTVPLPSPAYSDVSTASTEQSLKILKRNADRWGGHTDEILSGERRGFAAPLTCLAESLWRPRPACSDEEPPSCEGAIIMETCDDPYAEAEATASHILELLRAGARCRDIVIIMRDASSYRGIIEPALEKAEIPFFFSEKTELCAKAPVKFILTALKIYRCGWRKSDVLAHVKTGLCDLEPRECDMFEEYVNTWGITGARFTGDAWSMNPDGYTGRLTERGKLILKTANSVRERLYSELQGLCLRLEASDTAADMCRAVYEYAEKCELRKKSLALAEKELSFGNKKSASELASVYDLMLGALADIGEALADAPVSADDFYTVLKTVFEQTDVGTIPTSVDEITVGSASTLRSSKPDYVFVLGLCEGEFPAAADDSGLLGNNDRHMLSELGIELGTNAEIRSSDELMFVRRAFSAPRKKLYLLTHTADARGSARTPSLPFRRAEKLFCDLKPHRYRGDELSYLCGSPRSAASHLRTVEEPAERAAATLAVSEHIPLAAYASALSTSTDECRISPELAAELIGDKIYISPSSLEKYVKCPFGYYTGYMLSLRETRRGTFGANNVGDFVHYVMEHIISFALPEGSDGVPTDEEIVKKVGELVDEYVRLTVPDDSLNTQRIRHLYGKLRRLSLLVAQSVIRELSDSEFRPIFFEFHIDGRGGRPAPLDIPLENGARLILKGYADRVDLWRDGGRSYVRIVDYKTGSKQFELSDLRRGINTQMLLYLFAICRNPGTALLQKCGADGEPPVPAGVVYLSSAFPKITLSDFADSEAEIMRLAASELTRSGLLLDDERVIDAVSKTHSEELLMGIKKKDGKYVGKALISEEDFGELYEEISDTLKLIGKNIYGGIADCSPLEGEDPCRYCKSAPICRQGRLERRRR